MWCHFNKKNKSFLQFGFAFAVSPVILSVLGHNNNENGNVRNLSEEYKKMYASDSKESQVVESFKYPKFINFSMIKGNWMLVSVLDIEKRTKIGWLKWRDEDGKLLAFPFFEEQ